jgi:hypothetical protein
MDDFPKRPERRAVELVGFALLPDGKTIAATLVDLSYEGCKIRTEGPFSPGDQLKLSVFDRGLIDAEVRWFENGIAGLTFGSYAPPAKPLWPRRSERVAVTASLTLRKPGQANFRVRVVDASPEGCKIEFVDRPSIGDRIWVKFDGLETLESEVCWVENFMMGVTFARPLHPAVFDLIIERLNQGDS